MQSKVLLSKTENPLQEDVLFSNNTGSSIFAMKTKGGLVKEYNNCIPFLNRPLPEIMSILRFMQTTRRKKIEDEKDKELEHQK